MSRLLLGTPVTARTVLGQKGVCNVGDMGPGVLPCWRWECQRLALGAHSPPVPSRPLPVGLHAPARLPLTPFLWQSKPLLLSPVIGIPGRLKFRLLSASPQAESATSPPFRDKRFSFWHHTAPL